MPSSIDFEHLLRRLAEREGGYDVVHPFAQPAKTD
jgi:hypothetical protein